MSKHTPGPWKANERQIWQVINPDDASSYGLGSVVAETRLYFGHGSEAEPRHAEAEANARLIAAAPDLLSALKEMLTRCTFDGEYGAGHFVTVAREAVAKAEGRTDG